MKSFYPNPKTRAHAGAPEDRKKSVPAGALTKSKAKTEDRANDGIHAVNNYNNAREGMNPRYWQVHDALEKFDHNRLYLGTAVALFIGAIAAEVSVSMEYLKTLGMVVAGVIVAAIVLCGVTGTSLTVGGFRLRGTNTSRAVWLIASGVAVILIGAGTLLYLSLARTAYYAAYDDVMQYTTYLPLVLYIMECASGWFAERYLNYVQLKSEQKSILDEWNELLKKARQLQRETRQAWVEYATLFEEKHGHAPDLHKEGTEKIIYILETTITEHGDFGNGGDDDNEIPAAATEPIPDKPDTPQGAAPAAQNTTHNDLQNEHNNNEATGAMSDAQPRQQIPEVQNPAENDWQAYQDDIDLSEIND